MTEPLLELRDLRLDIDTFDGRLQVLDGIGFRLARGETLGLVGETGCGKSVTAKSILRLLPSPPARLRGAINFQGKNLLTLDAGRLRELRGRRIAMVFQDPMTYLNPVFSVGRQLLDVIAANYRPGGAAPSRSEARQRALQLLAQVQLPNPERQLRAYPHQLSGGMRQRVLIAMALAGEPALLIADEPTTALDVTIQAQILRLIGELVDTLGLAVLMISHDLGVVAKVCRRIAVMYAGTVVEDAPAGRLFAAPQHPYTQGLLQAIPRLEGERRPLSGIPGNIPSLLDPPPGCRFQPRCPRAFARCQREKPLPRPVAAGHTVACHLYD